MNRLKRAVEVGAMVAAAPVAAVAGLIAVLDALGVIVVVALVFLSIPLNLVFPPDEMRIKNDLEVRVGLSRCDKVGWRSEGIEVQPGESKVAHPVMACIAFAGGEYLGCLFFPKDYKGVPTISVSEMRREIDEARCDRSGRHEPKIERASTLSQLPWLRISGISAGVFSIVFVLATCVAYLVMTLRDQSA